MNGLITSLVRLLVAAVVFTLPAFAAGTEDFPPLIKNGVVKLNGKPLYFVHLEDAPLALHASTSQTGNFHANGRLDVNADASRSYRSSLLDRQLNLEALISSEIGSAVTVTQRFQLALNAIVISLDENDAERVRALPGVVRVERVELHELQTDRGPSHIGAPQVWTGIDGQAGNMGEGIIVGIIDSGIRTDHPAFADVGDDGYDHTNPRGRGNYLGDCVDDPSLCNDKLIGVISYPEITATYGGIRPANGYDYNGHGTHVASTAAGNVLHDVPGYNGIGGEGEYEFAQLSGVAPHANIVSYQTCFPYGTCLNVAAVGAIEHAIEHGVDVLNYSVSGMSESPWASADALAYLSARAAGIHVATSASNRGPGPSTVGTPGNSPWVTSVAAYTHDRAMVAIELTDFSGGVSPPASPIIGAGVTFGYQGFVVNAANHGDALCLEPFPRGAFNGEIVICERGENARVEKGRNVKAGGAGGMILINVAGGESDLYTDFHELPAIHVDAAAGEALLEWLEEGDRHAAHISAGGIGVDESAADIAGVFTSRGPLLPYASLPGPHVAAPGVNIYAAWVEDAPFRDDEFTAPYVFIDGTSMASPHVAGALALLKNAHPDWTPAEAQSALMTTAFTDTYRDHEGNPSTLFDGGSGRVDVTAAVQAGLILDEDEQDYLDANPETGGDPMAINIAAMANDSCLLSCSWQRTVKGVQSSSWTVQTESSTGMTLSVEPPAFSLTAGEEQTLTITASIDGEGATDSWAHGRVRLQPSADGISPASLPVAAKFRKGVAPEFHSVETRRNIDSTEVPGFASIATNALHIDTHGPTQATLHEAVLREDPTPDYPVDVVEDFVHVTTVTTNSNTVALIAEILEAEANDLDLFIARDADLNGQPNGGELLSSLCTSATEIALERCVVMNPPPGVYWVAVQNFSASSPDAADRHVLSVATVQKGDGGKLQVTAPAQIEHGEPFSLDASMNLPAEPGDVHYAAIGVGTSATSPGDVGQTVLRIKRAEDDFTVGVDRNSVIAGQAVTYTWSVAAASEHDVAREYAISASLPPGVEAVTDSTGSIETGVARWSFVQNPGADAVVGSLTLDTQPSETGRELTLEFATAVDDGALDTVIAPAVTVAPIPVAKINGKRNLETEIEEGALLTLDVAGTVPSRAQDVLTYTWEQLQGPSLPLEAISDTEYSFAAPSVNADTTFAFRLDVRNEVVSGAPATFKVTVRNAPPPAAPAPSGGSGGGGAGSWLLMLLLLTVCRERIRQERH